MSRNMKDEWICERKKRRIMEEWTKTWKDRWEKMFIVEWRKIKKFQTIFLIACFIIINATP